MPAPSSPSRRITPAPCLPGSWQRISGSWERPVTACDTIRGGVSLALEQAGPGGTVLCYGSLYLIGDVETQLRDLKKS